MHGKKVRVAKAPIATNKFVPGHSPHDSSTKKKPNLRPKCLCQNL